MRKKLLVLIIWLYYAVTAASVLHADPLADVCNISIVESGLGVITASLVGRGNTSSIFAFDRRQDSLVLNVTVTVRPSAGLSFMDGFVTEDSA